MLIVSLFVVNCFKLPFTQLDISYNNFSGTVPSDSFPSSLKYFYASNNQYTTISTSMYSKIGLLVIDLSYNNLNDSYAGTSRAILMISIHFLIFTFAITAVIGGMPTPTSAEALQGQCLISFDLSHNQIYCPEGVDFEFHTSWWPNIMTIDISYNLLSGSLVLDEYPFIVIPFLLCF
jgi:hypothetical protein